MLFMINKKSDGEAKNSYFLQVIREEYTTEVGKLSNITLCSKNGIENYLFLFDFLDFFETRFFLRPFLFFLFDVFLFPFPLRRFGINLNLFLQSPRLLITINTFFVF